jgi:hypothetical protein
MPRNLVLGVQRQRLLINRRPDAGSSPRGLNMEPEWNEEGPAFALSAHALELTQSAVLRDAQAVDHAMPAMWH